MKSPEQIARQHADDVRESWRLTMVKRLIEAVKTLTEADITEADLEQDKRGYYWTWDIVYRLRPDSQYGGARIERLIDGQWIQAMVTHEYDLGHSYETVLIAGNAGEVATAVEYFNAQIQRLQKRKGHRLGNFRFFRQGLSSARADFSHSSTCATIASDYLTGTLKDGTRARSNHRQPA